MKTKIENRARRETKGKHPGTWIGWDFDSTKLPEPPKPDERDIFRPKMNEGVFEFNPSFET